MNPPEFEPRGNIYLFTWQEGLHVRVDHVKRHTNGNISGEITVKPNQLSDGHLHHSVMSNLLGPRIRSDVVHACSELASDYPWKYVIELVCEKTVEAVRAGSPAKPIVDVKISEASEWRLYPLLHEHQATVLFGYGGSFKSMFAGYLAVRICFGIDAEPGNVLVLDWESDEQDWRKRVGMIANGLGQGEPPNLYYRPCYQPLADELEEVEAQVAELGISVVIIDSAAYACGGEPEKADPTMVFFRSVRTLGCTALIIAHQNRDERSRRPFGSVYWENSPRSCVQVRRSEESQGGLDAEIGLWQTKRNHRGFRPIGYGITFHTFDQYEWDPNDSVDFKQKAMQDTDFTDGGTQGEQVMAFLNRNGPCDYKALSEGTGFSRDRLRPIMARLAKRGSVVNRAGLWAAPEQAAVEEEAL